MILCFYILYQNTSSLVWVPNFYPKVDAPSSESIALFQVSQCLFENSTCGDRGSSAAKMSVTSHFTARKLRLGMLVIYGKPEQ